MSPAEAAKLVERIIQTWPTGPRGRIWTEVLTDLDATRAHDTYTRLRTDNEHPPSIARFLALYRSLALDLDWTVQIAQSYTPDAISLDEYRNRLTARAAQGDQTAEAEAATWNRLKAR